MTKNDLDLQPDALSAASKAAKTGNPESSDLEEIVDEINLEFEQMDPLYNSLVTLNIDIGTGKYLLFTDESARGSSETISFSLSEGELLDLLATLTPREEKVLKLRLGLEDGRTYTPEEVAKKRNVPCERIRQIEAKALHKLRYRYYRNYRISKRRAALSHFLDP